jgi:dienelactone hydrolase
MQALKRWISRHWKAVVGGLGALGLLGLLVGHAVKLYADAHYYDGYDAKAPLNVKLGDEQQTEGNRVIPFSFEGLPGLRVPSLLILPEQSAARLPCILFLHGIGQNKKFLPQIASQFTRQGYAIVCIDQYNCGERKQRGLGIWQSVLALRRRGALNVIESRRLLDYLQTRPELDPQRFVLLGASYGAITGVNVAAFEPRLHSIVQTYGGGDLSLLLDSNQARRQLGRWRAPVMALAAYILAPADPIRHVKALAPRPVLFQNGEADGLVPAASARALYAAAGEPRRMIWYPGGHIGEDRGRVVQILDEALDWLKMQPPGGAAAKLGAPEGGVKKG